MRCAVCLCCAGTLCQLLEVLRVMTALAVSIVMHALIEYCPPLQCSALAAAVRFCLQLQHLTAAAMSLNQCPHCTAGSSEAHSVCRFVGVGFLVPQVINYSMMVGAVVFFGILLPLIHNKAGEWYPEGQPASSWHRQSG